MSSSSSLDHFLPSSPSEQLCYVHCTVCDTVLVVSVPCSSLFKNVTVRCGHCTNLLSVNMRALLAQTLLSHAAFVEPTTCQAPPSSLCRKDSTPLASAAKRAEEPANAPSVNRPPEKRQRMPSAYNRFIKDEIQRIKAENPDITHREAFSAAAKNWAHFPHIHFGLVPDGGGGGLRKSSKQPQEADQGGMMMRLMDS